MKTTFTSSPNKDEVLSYKNLVLCKTGVIWPYKAALELPLKRELWLKIVQYFCN